MQNHALTRILFIALVSFGLVTSFGCEKDKERKDELRALWLESFRVAEESDGPAAAKILTKNSIERYDRLLKAGLTAKSAEVLKMRPADQIEIVRMRNRATKKQLQGYTGKGFVIYLHESGLVRRVWRQRV